MSVDLNPKEEELCLVDSCTTNSILREIKYFQTLKKKDEKYCDHRWSRCNSIGHDMEKAKFPQNKDFCCTSCATGKLILRPSYLKIRAEPLKFLERI